MCCALVANLGPVAEFVEYLSRNDASLLETRTDFKLILKDLSSSITPLSKTFHENLNFRFNQRFSKELDDMIIYLSNLPLFRSEHSKKGDLHEVNTQTKLNIERLYNLYSNSVDFCQNEEIKDCTSINNNRLVPFKNK